MKKEELKALGVPDAVIDKVVEAVKKEMEGFVPKSRLDTEIQAKNSYKTSLEAAQAKISELSKFEGTVQDLQKKIQEYTDNMATQKTQYEAKITGMLKKSLVNDAILAREKKPYDVGIVSNMIDFEKVLFDKDCTKIISGLAEQLDTIEKEKAFLFPMGKGNPNPKGNEPGEGEPDPKSKEKEISDFVHRLSNQKLNSLGVKVEPKGGSKE